MRVQRAPLVAVVIGLGFALAPVVPSAHDPITTRVTWTAEISRIVEARCVSCHRPGGRAPMSLASYGDARPWARAIREEVLTRRMPKWHLVRGYGEFSNDPSLSPFEIALIVAWADGGAPLGSDAEAGERTGEQPEARRRPWSGDGADAEADPPGTSVRTSGQTTRDVTVGCGDAALPEGVLLAVTPALERGGSVGIAVALPDGRREIVAWVRNFEPDFAASYRLRTPLDLPKGSRVTAEYREPASPEPRAPTPEPCSIRFTIAAPR